MDKKKIEVLGAIAIILILLILLIWIFTRSSPIQPRIDPGTVEPPADIAVLNTPVKVADPIFTPNPIARMFVERFGSFSSESGYTNVEDVAAVATEDLRGRLLQIAYDAREGVPGSYYGISTRVISMDMTEETEESAVMMVQTQREESIDNITNTKVRYQNIQLSMVRSGDNWLVNDFSWQ